MSRAAERWAVLAWNFVVWLALTAIFWVWPRIGMALVAALTVGAGYVLRDAWRGLQDSVGDAP